MILKMPESQGRLACPHCGSELSASLRCQSCEYELHCTDGVLSPSPRAAHRFEGDERVIYRAASGDLEAYDQLLDVPQSIINEWFDNRKGFWASVLRDRSLGAVLDLSPGPHDRILGLLADELYVAGESFVQLKRLATLAARDSTDHTTALHADDAGPAVSSGSFDTVVVDRTDGPVSVDEATSYLKADGELLVRLKATPELLRTELGALVSEGRPADGVWEMLQRFVTNSFPLTRRTLERRFDTVVPFVHVWKAFFRLDQSTDALRRLRAMGETMSYHRGLELATRLGGGAFVFPRFVFLCSNNGNIPDSFGKKLLVSGNNRAISVDPSGQRATIRKIPLGYGCGEYNVREQTVTRAIHKALKNPATVPTPDAETTALGPVLTERLARGSPLSQLLTESTYETAFDLGWDWLTQFQRATESSTVTRSAEEVRADLSVPSVGLSPPRVTPTAVTLGPVHGDYQPRNVFVDDGTITRVIDWEYGGLEVPQVVDAAQYVLKSAYEVFGSLEAAITRGLSRSTQFGRFVRSRIEQYCSERPLSPTGFYQYLAYPYVRFLKIHEQDQSPSFYTDMCYMTRAVERVWETLDEL